MRFWEILRDRQPMRRLRRPMHAFVAACTPARMASASLPAKYHAVRCLDRPGALAVRKENRSAHIEWAEQSGVLFGGPLLTPPGGEDGQHPQGSLLVMDGSADAVRDALAKDPYKTAGLFADVDAREWVCGMRSESVAPDGGNAYLVWCVDKEGMKDVRAATRPAHLDWWRSSGRQGMIGPFPAADGNGAVGTMIVCSGSSVEEVQTWAATDPYNGASMFDSVGVFEMSRTIDKFFV